MSGDITAALEAIRTRQKRLQDDADAVETSRDIEALLAVAQEVLKLCAMSPMEWVLIRDLGIGGKVEKADLLDMLEAELADLEPLEASHG